MRSERATPSAIVVLGCRAIGTPLGGALARRMALACEVARSYPELPLLFSGGKLWNGASEADHMAHWWAERGLPNRSLLLEKTSLTTLENADYSKQLLCREGFAKESLPLRIALVTCDFHSKRAARLFARFGFEVESHRAVDPNRTTWQAMRLSLRELGALCLEPWSRRA